MVVVEAEIEVLRLEEDASEDRRHGGGETAKTIINVLRHEGNTVFEFFTVDWRAAPHTYCVAPRSPCRIVEGATRAKFARHKGIDGRAHGWVVRWTEAGKDTR